jgi:hypothetical protein
MSRVPSAKRTAPAAVDASPAYSSGRGNALTKALMPDLEAEEERRSELYAALNPKSNEACELLRSGDSEAAARLFVDLAASWHEAGFHQEASSCMALANAARNPRPVAPKTIGRRGKKASR